MDYYTELRRKGERLQLARWLVTYSWRMYNEWNKLDPLAKTLLPSELFNCMIALMVGAEIAWDLVNAEPELVSSSEERRQAKSTLN